MVVRASKPDGGKQDQRSFRSPDLIDFVVQVELMAVAWETQTNQSLNISIQFELHLGSWMLQLALR